MMLLRHKSNYLHQARSAIFFAVVKALTKSGSPHVVTMAEIGGDAVDDSDIYIDFP